MAGVDAALQQEAEAALSCPICLGFFHEPVLLPCCQQSFCRACLQDALDRSTTACPLCRADTSMRLALPNRALEGLLRNHAAAPTIAAAANRVGPPLPGSEPLPAMMRRPRWRPDIDDNPFLPRQRRTPVRNCGEWLAKHEARIRCVTVVAAVGLLMVFLKVEEEEYAVQTGYLPRRGGGVPRLARLGEAPGSRLPGELATLRSRRLDPSAIAGATEEEAATDILSAAHRPTVVDAQLNASAHAYMLFVLIVAAIAIYRRVLACTAGVRVCYWRRVADYYSLRAGGWDGMVRRSGSHAGDLSAV